MATKKDGVVILSADEAEFALEELRQRGKMLGQIVTADKKKASPIVVEKAAKVRKLAQIIEAQLGGAA